MTQIQNYIAGQLVSPQQGQYLDNVNPATGKVYSQVPDSQPEDVAAAYEAAKAAFPLWSSLSIQERSQYLEKIANRITERLDELALAESRDNGKPVWLAKKVDIPRAADNFRYFSHAITQFHNESFDMGQQGFNYTLRRPIGVAGLISPWNLPLYLFTWKIAPALAAGNTCVAKPSEVTPMTAFLLSEICVEIGLPAGVLNIVHGTGPNVGEPIVQHPDIPMISFTGSTRVGQRIAEVAAPMFKKVSLEMGGKNANLVFADADYDHAVKTSVRAAFTNQGQICLCGSRIFVQREIYDQFVRDFVAEVKNLKVGDPELADSKVGAIVSKAQFEKDLSYVEVAKSEGGKIEIGGKAATLEGRCSGGYFIEPTVITGLDAYCRVNQEEIFGPIVTIQPFETDEQALEYANSTPYGLSCTLFTQNLQRAHRLAAEIEAGIVWVNNWMVRDLRTPFGGVKQSGIGREGGFEALRFFTEPKNVFIQL
ncbi:aldehyde dehydrogenase [Pontibacter sp. G13]|uniref:aldehyde dehydrogenase n=1 Tax=Pontibacter sp. G13 TaxID=3074898 RepID=UPI00288AD376|nr:aldehyde dehydrogenase [Pontibacter sp. G13]WNJ16130.1 aldehyde dehydrogenase [Pontibacter sp. G13]